MYTDKEMLGSFEGGRDRQRDREILGSLRERERVRERIHAPWRQRGRQRKRETETEIEGERDALVHLEREIYIC